MKKIVALLFLVCSAAFAQDDYIFLKRAENVTIEYNKHQFNIKKDVSQVGKYLTSNKLYFSNEFIPFDSFTKIDNIEAYTLLPDSTKKTVDHIETKHEFDNGIFFSDQQLKNFVFPGVTKDATTHLSYTETVSVPQFLGVFQFGSFVPTQEAAITVNVPKNVELGFTGFNLEPFGVSFSKTETNNGVTYNWKANNVRAFRGSENSLPVNRYLPHLILYIKNYTEGGKKHNILNDASDLYKWYHSLVQQISKEELKSVKSTAEKLASGQPDTNSKAKAIFNWVQDNITYVAFEDGLGGFIPRNAETVVTKRYGDCKDMANVLYEMLNHVGIKAHHAWIGTRDRPYSYKDVPTPVADNHMITAAIIDNDTIFLDATDSYVPFGMPSAFTQGKEAMIGIDANNFVIKKVPVQPKELSKASVKTTASLNGTDLLASENRIMEGYEKVEFIYGYTYKKETKTNEEYLNTTLKLGNNKTAYSNIALGDLEDRTNPFKLGFDYEINNYAKLVGNKIFVNLNLDPLLTESEINIEKQEFGKKIEHAFVKEYETIFTLPDGYKAVSVPEASVFEDVLYGFNIQYKLIDNQTLALHKTVYVNTLEVEKEGFEAWNNFIKSLIKANKKNIILEKIQ